MKRADGKIIRWLIVGAIVLAILAIGANTGTFKRFYSGATSNLQGGTQREAILYSNDGKEMQRWSGKIDVSESENETYMIVDGKPVITHGGIVVVE